MRHSVQNQNRSGVTGLPEIPTHMRIRWQHAHSVRAATRNCVTGP